MIETYAAYVWSCYAVTVAVWLFNIWAARRSRNLQLQAAQRRQQMQPEQG
jgi:heme exporter protein CcmD